MTDTGADKGRHEHQPRAPDPRKAVHHHGAPCGDGVEQAVCKRHRGLDRLRQAMIHDGVPVKLETNRRRDLRLGFDSRGFEPTGLSTYNGAVANPLERQA